jgi:hypothetical protein
MEHVVVYREPGRFAGWPANFGMWSWDREIVVGFTVGHLDPTRVGTHACDANRPFMPMQALSLDGGYTWQVIPIPCKTPGGRGISADEHVADHLKVQSVIDRPGELMDPPGDIDFMHPDFALMCARTGLHSGSRSWFYTTYDCCNTWQGPYALPLFGQSGVNARTAYIVDNAHTCTLFLSVTKTNGREGRVLCTRTADAGASFRMRSLVVADPPGYAIMPACLRLENGGILVAVRCSGDPTGYIEMYRSDDDALTWRLVSRPVPNTGRGGNPPTLTQLLDGRLCITYGYRSEPYGIRAVLSEDQGVTWSEPIALRSDAGNRDIGYPRTVQRDDGVLVTVYYYNDAPASERYIAATLWQP